jgi:hypothetical protein
MSLEEIRLELVRLVWSAQTTPNADQAVAEAERLMRFVTTGTSEVREQP